MRKSKLKLAMAALAATAAAAGGTSVALASIPSHHGTITGCYNTHTGALRIVHSVHACRSGERVLQWKVDGGRGVAGPAGKNGANGKNGKNGTDGNTLLNGAGVPGAGLGSNGDFYLDTSSDTLYGPKAAGAWPTPGTSLKGGAGGSAVLAASSGTASNLTTVAGGLSGNVGLLPLSGVGNADATLSGGTIDASTGAPAGIPQVLPRDGTVTAVAAHMVTTVAQSLVGTTITITAQLYTNGGSGDTRSPVAGTTCTLAPALTGVLAIGTDADCVLTGLSVPVTAGSTAAVVVSATAAGVSLINTVPVDVTTSITLG